MRELEEEARQYAKESLATELKDVLMLDLFLPLIFYLSSVQGLKRIQLHRMPLAPPRLDSSGVF